MKPPHIVLLLVLAGALLFWFNRDDPAAKAQAAQVKQQAEQQADERREARVKALYLKRLQVEDRREIAPGQTITVLLVPDSTMPQMEFMDKRCVIYEHTSFRTVKMFCDGVPMDDGPSGYDDPEPEPRY